MGIFERLFGLKEHGATLRIELLGGATTFITMAYIIVVNPAILSFAGIPKGPCTVATILAAAFGSLLMGLYANRPIAVAPYMGENAFIAFGLATMGIAWQQRLGTVFVSGAAFALLTVLGLRQWLAESISVSMKHSFAVGIGLFLMLIGLYETGIVTSPVRGMSPDQLLGAGGKLLAPDVPLVIGNMHDREVLLAIGGFVVIVALMCWRVRGAILIGIVLTAVAGYALGAGHARAPEKLVSLPFTGEFDIRPIALHLDIAGVVKLDFLPILLTLFLMSFLDTLGTLTAVGAAGNLLDEKGNFPGIERPMLVDAISCMFSALIGTSTSGAYIESAAGIREGARTGLAAMTTAALFLISLFFIPLVAPLQEMRYAYGPALIAVGVLMFGAIAKIDFADLTETAPALATIAMMLFSYNIANGLTAGLVLYPVLKILGGCFKDLNAGSIVLALASAVYFVFGLPH